MVCFVWFQILGRIVLSSTLALSFHIALVFLRVSEDSSRCILTHRKTHAWSGNASKNRKPDIINFRR